MLFNPCPVRGLGYVLEAVPGYLHIYILIYIIIFILR